MEYKSINPKVILSHLNNNDHIDSFINIYHKNKFTLSNLDFKIITNDSSRSILFAKAIIEKDQKKLQDHINLVNNQTNIVAQSNIKLENQMNMKFH